MINIANVRNEVKQPDPHEGQQKLFVSITVRERIRTATTTLNLLT